MKSKFYVYIICSKKNNQIYIGVTQNLAKRLFDHNNNLSGYTKYKGPWELIWYSVFFNREKAEEFEKYLKSHSGRAFINKRIINPA
jgi:predicted GIY-YIG superfamily endonuclease